MIVASVLGRTPQGREIVDRLVAATDSHTLQDLTAIHACRERLDGGFHGAPIFGQAEDGSFVVSDNEATFGRMVDAAAAGAVAARSGGG